MYPSDRMTSPEPTPPDGPPPAKMVTTDGSSSSAMDGTSQDDGPAVAFSVVVALDGELTALAVRAPATPAAIRTTTPTTSGRARRRRASPDEDITEPQSWDT